MQDSKSKIIDKIKFNEKGLVPVIVQDYENGDVLMMAYMNKEAIEKTLITSRAHYFSRSRGKLWLKGETSGNFQHVKDILYDCDEDTLLLKVEQKGVACHTGERTCFFRRLEEEVLKGEKPEAATVQGSKIIDEVFKIILQRRRFLPDNSYVASLYRGGLEKVLQKVEEELGELLAASRNGGREDIIHETADLWFHTLVLLGEKEISPEDIYNELKRRFGRSGIEEKESRRKKSKS